LTRDPEVGGSIHFFFILARPAGLVIARTAYDDFFTLWKDADPDVPILKQARAEYGKVQ
jgi:hypothetical protein